MYIYGKNLITKSNAASRFLFTLSATSACAARLRSSKFSWFAPVDGTAAATLIKWKVRWSMAVHLALCWAGFEQQISARLARPNIWLSVLHIKQQTAQYQPICMFCSFWRIQIVCVRSRCYNNTRHSAFRHNMRLSIWLWVCVCAIHREMEWVKGRQCEITLAMYALTRSHPISLSLCN